MLATISCSLYRVVQWTRKLGHKKPEEKPPKRNKTHDLTYMYVEVSFLFRSVPFQCVRWFRFGFSQKPKTRRLDGRPLFFFSRPRPNVREHSLQLHVHVLLRRVKKRTAPSLNRFQLGSRRPIDLFTSE